jgi:hypothetical protein
MMLSKYFCIVCVHSCVRYECARVCAQLHLQTSMQSFFPYCFPPYVFLKIIFHLCAWVFCLPVSTPYACITPAEARRGRWSPQELKLQRAVSNMGPVLLTPKPSLQPLHLFFFFETGSLTEQKIHQLSRLHSSSGDLPVFIPEC